MTIDVAALERRFALAVAVVTVPAGGARLAAAGPVLGLIAGGAPDAAAAHLFRTAGMFMVLFGGGLLHAMRRPAALKVVLPWAGFQKLLAAGLVGTGVELGIFASVALLVSIFDALSGVLYLRRRGG